MAIAQVIQVSSCHKPDATCSNLFEHSAPVDMMPHSADRDNQDEDWIDTSLSIDPVPDV